MACFPRFRVFQRTKSSFNPAVDENTDTILKNDDNAVQIGRYIRHEETPLIIAKVSERSQKQITRATQNGQQTNSPLAVQQPQPEENSDQLRNHINKTANSNNSSFSKTTNNNNSFNNAPKKFISNKGHLHLQISRTSSSYSSNSNSPHIYNTNNTSNSLSYSGSYVSNKLKPVKGRRPTALPSEVPHIEEDGRPSADSTDSRLTTNGEATTPTTPTTPSSMQNVRFFIGGQHRSEAENASSTGGHSPNCSDTLSGKYKPLTAASERDYTNSNRSSRAMQTPTTSTTASPTPAYRQSSVSNFAPPDRKSRSKQLRKGLRGQEQPPTEEVYIPPPPPIPPQPLTTAESTGSLRSLRSNKAKHRSSNLNSGGQQQQGLLEEGGISANTELGKALTTDAPANDKFSSFDRQTCTLSELLNFSSNSSDTAIGRDSGVQFEDQTPTSTDSEAPQARLEGGLIYTRPNLPTKKNVHIEFIEKSEDTRNLIRKAIERNDFLNNYMDKERKEMVIAAMAPAFYEKDSYIIHENDEGSEIYVSETGYFDVIKSGKLVGSFGPATVFGELAILYNANRLASVRVTSNARVWKITRETFRQIMVLSESKEREENLNFLRSAPFLNDLATDVLNKVVDLLQRKYYEPKACIVREGEIGNEFFIIRGGTVTIKKKNEQNVERVVDRRKRGDYFGEQALLNADRRQASVYADAPGTEVLKLDREAFISYLGTIPQLREKPERHKAIESRTSSRKSEFDNEFAHIQLTELRKVTTLGAGAFGRVDLVAYEGKTFALKIIKKIDVIKQDQVEHIYSEKQVMMKCRSSPFVIELYKTFRNEKFVYFLMEACMGGDVWTVMSQRRFFDEKTSKFIAGCVVEAFDFLHSHDIIYRDLKPENLMLTTDGYCKLVDFGFAKHIPRNQKTNTFAGTPEYVAPEIILDRGHDRAVDYWALGILIYELLVGKTPFREQNQIKIYQQILGGIDVIQMPSKIPRSAQNLIKQLCKQLPVERLGYQRRGILDIKKHSWFDSLDWNKLKYKQLPSPIKRPITSNTDTQYFGPVGVEHEYEPPDETSGWDIDF